MTAGPSFQIPKRPQRRFPYSGGVEYVGETIFLLTPDQDRSNPTLSELVEATLADGPYRYGNFLTLPMDLFLVRDDETGDVFRVSIRNGTVRFHVLPETGSTGLRRLYDRLVDRTTVGWHVECQTSE
jgi:hypothetical protein